VALLGGVVWGGARPDAPPRNVGPRSVRGGDSGISDDELVELEVAGVGEADLVAHELPSDGRLRVHAGDFDGVDVDDVADGGAGLAVVLVPAVRHEHDVALGVAV